MIVTSTQGEAALEQLMQALEEVSAQLYDKMDEVLPDPDTGVGTIAEAMRYAALSGGKRLRPFLTVQSAKLFGISNDAALHVATAIEFIHTYSLIHDDLPAMDDDDLRRGQPATHIKFGEAAGILAGDALLTYAFQILADRDVHADPSVRCELIRSLAAASGFRGMVGGQMMDLESENEELSIDQVIRLQRLKTGELFAVSCEAGAILGKAPWQMRNALKAYAHDIGLAFQIRDDLLDAEGTRSETGKTVRKDEVAGKATLVSIMGVERAKEQSRILAEQAIRHLDVFDAKAQNLRKLAEYIVTRRS
jgi:farnesyl diphosphate synthase